MRETRDDMLERMRTRKAELFGAIDLKRYDIVELPNTSQADKKPEPRAEPAHGCSPKQLAPQRESFILTSSPS